MWYEQVFREVAKAYKLEDEMDVHDEIIRRRLILHFKQKNLPFDEIRANIEQVKAGFAGDPQLLVVDGFPFEEATPQQLAEWQAFATENNVAVWFSATLHREQLDLDEHGVPAPVNKYYDQFDVIIMLNPKHDYIDFTLLKANKNANGKIQIKLDPKTLLISNHRI
jgi:hypothetical protein